MKHVRHEGFTLIELLTVIALLIIILTLAIPGFDTMTRNNRIRNQANDFYMALMLARSEALERLSRVTICPSADNFSCTTSGSWELGWIIFNDDDDDAVFDNGTETILHIGSGLSAGNTLRGNRSVSSYISFIGNGYTRKTSGAFQAGTFVLCDDRGFGDEARAIIINATGRTRIVKATDSSATRCDL